MGLGMKFFNPKNYKAMWDIGKISSSLNRHMKKRCAYCDMDMGLGDDYPVVEFVEHLAAQHSDKIAPEEVEGYRKLIKRMTK